MSSTNTDTESASDTAGESASEQVLRTLLAQTEPEDRERLRVAWERHARGHPDSLPVLYALADRFSVTAHAVLLDRQEKLLESFQAQWGGTPSHIPKPHSAKNPGIWITGALCLATAITGAAVARIIPTEGEKIMRQIKAAGGELVHNVKKRDGRVFQVLELKTTTTTPEAYLTPELHGVIVFEDHSATTPPPP